jgi:SAM-dependent methyltransferase
MITAYVFNSFAKVLETIIVLKQLKPKRGEMICNLGCGLGNNDIVLALKKTRVFGVDIHKEFLPYAKANAQRLHFDVSYSFADLEQGLPFKTGTFDKAISFCVLEHLEKPELMVREVRRILRKRGALVLSIDSFSVPHIPFGLQQLHKKHCHVQNYFDRDAIGKMLERNGFEVEEYRFFIRSRLSCFFFERLLFSYFQSEIRGSIWTLRFFKVACPALLTLACIADSLVDDKDGGYWLAVRARKRN